MSNIDFFFTPPLSTLRMCGTFFSRLNEDIVVSNLTGYPVKISIVTPRVFFGGRTFRCFDTFDFQNVVFSRNISSLSSHFSLLTSINLISLSCFYFCRDRFISLVLIRYFKPYHSLSVKIFYFFLKLRCKNFFYFRPLRHLSFFIF